MCLKPPTAHHTGKVLRGPLYDQRGNAILTDTNNADVAATAAVPAGDTEFAQEKRMLQQLQATQEVPDVLPKPAPAAPVVHRGRLATPPGTPPAPPRRRSSIESRTQSPGVCVISIAAATS